MLGNRRIRFSRAARMPQRSLYRPLLILVGTPEPVRLIGREAVPLCILLSALADVAGNLFQPCLRCGLASVKPIGKPVISPVVEDSDGRKRYTGQPGIRGTRPVRP